MAFGPKTIIFNSPTYTTRMNTTASAVRYISFGGGVNGRAFLLFRDIFDKNQVDEDIVDYLELTVFEETFSKKESTAVPVIISLHKAHKHDSSKPHLAIKPPKSKNNSESDNLFEKSVIVGKILSRHYELSSEELNEIADKGMPAVYEFIRKKSLNRILLVMKLNLQQRHVLDSILF